MAESKQSIADSFSETLKQRLEKWELEKDEVAQLRTEITNLQLLVSQWRTRSSEARKRVALYDPKKCNTTIVEDLSLVTFSARVDDAVVGELQAAIKGRQVRLAQLLGIPVPECFVRREFMDADTVFWRDGISEAVYLSDSRLSEETKAWCERQMTLQFCELEVGDDFDGPFCQATNSGVQIGRCGPMRIVRVLDWAGIADDDDVPADMPDDLKRVLNFVRNINPTSNILVFVHGMTSQSESEALPILS